MWNALSDVERPLRTPQRALRAPPDFPDYPSVKLRPKHTTDRFVEFIVLTVGADNQRLNWAGAVRGGAPAHKRPGLEFSSRFWQSA